MKYLLNAYPKSGSQTFAKTLIKVVTSFRKGSLHLPESDNWVICQYEPVVHLGNFGEDVYKISIIRNPSDAITINTERHFLGFLGKQIYGTSLMDKEKDVLTSKTELTPYDKDFIDHQIERYNSYTDCLLKNIKNTMCFTNEQTRTQTKQCLQNILELSGVDYSQIQKDIFTENIIDKIPYHPFSLKIREYLESRPRFARNYDYLMDEISKKQTMYPISLNS